MCDDEIITEQTESVPEIQFSTELRLFAQMAQKLADRCQRAQRDETNPLTLRWRMYGNSEAYSLIAEVLRARAESEDLLGVPPNDTGLLQMYKMFLDMQK